MLGYHFLITPIFTTNLHDFYTLFHIPTWLLLNSKKNKFSVTYFVSLFYRGRKKNESNELNSKRGKVLRIFSKRVKCSAITF